MDFDDRSKAEPKRRASGPGRPVRATIATVAEDAGVSQMTVSNAINAPHLLRPETLERVQSSIERLQYQPNQAARSLRTRSAHSIGCRLLPPDRRGSGGVLDRFLYALSEAAGGADYGLSCYAAASDEDEIAIFDKLSRRHSVDGFVITGTRYADARPEWLVRHRVPFAAFGRLWGAESDKHSWVDIDGASGTAAATSHLIEQGHRRIAFVGWPKPNGLGEDRRSGWARTMKSWRLPVRGLGAVAADSIEAGAATALELLRSANPPTGFVCVSDAIAIGVLRAVEDHGLRAGADVGVVGFDDSVGAQLTRPGLSSVGQPLEAAADRLVRILLRHLERRQAAPEHVLLPPELVVRGSSLRR